VSFKTASRVVHGETTVTPELAARVRAAIAELGYELEAPGADGTSRRRAARTRTVAAILEDLANPFTAAVHRAVVDTMRERGITVLSASSDEDPDDERRAYLAFVARRVDGIVLMPTSADHTWLHEERVRRARVVMVDRPARGFDADVVVSDNRAGAERATAHLIGAGHRRIAYLGDLPAIHTAAERFAGYRKALAVAGCRRSVRLERQGLRDGEQALWAVLELMGAAQPPTAIFAAQNLLTIGAVRALRRLGLHHRVALVGFDDVELADTLDPGVTVVAQDPAAIGRTAAGRLLRRLDGEAEPPQTFVVPTRLVVRGSGEIGEPARRSIA
jgi:LacI family transcriptional regulator